MEIFNENLFFREIPVSQADEIIEQYEQEYQQMATSGQEQHVYIYDHPIMTPAQQSTGVHLKREIADKEHNENLIDPSNQNVIVSEPPAVYVELKNENLEGIRYQPNVRYEPPPSERFHRHPGHYTYTGHMPTHHQQIHQREEIMKENEQMPPHSQQQEIRIYEPNQMKGSGVYLSNSGQQNQQQQQQLSGEHNIQVENSESKTQYTNLEPVTSHQNYYISSEPYQSTPNGNFTYLPPPTSKEYIYSSGSPVLYKSKKPSTIDLLLTIY